MLTNTLTLTPDLLLKAYAVGVFPMAASRDSDQLFWMDPRHRGVFALRQFHISRSLARRMRKSAYNVRLNSDFSGVLDGCAARSETWINARLRRVYLALHRIGHAHSLEIWQDGELTGGVFGVSLGGAFFGESMFSRRTDASKLALAHLTDHLDLCGFSLFDTQFITSHLASLGAREITRETYHAELRFAISRPAKIDARPLCSPQEVVQRRTQTS